MGSMKWAKLIVMACRAVGKSENPGKETRNNMVGKICPLVETELIFMTKTEIPHGPHSPTTLGLERATCFTINSTYVANVGCRISS